MNYKEKKLRENAFRNGLNELLIGAYASPCLNLTNRRAVVAAIHLGESTLHPQTSGYTEFPKNYQQVSFGLHNAFHEKISDSSETSERLKQAISVVSSLVAWAGNNANRTDEIFEKFAKEMVPEDFGKDPNSPLIDTIKRELHKELGVEKSFDFLTVSLEQFNKKYRDR